METPKATERNIFDPKVYEFDTLPYTRIPDHNEEFDMQQYINGFGGGGVSDHHHHAEEKHVEGRPPYLTSAINCNSVNRLSANLGYFPPPTLLPTYVYTGQHIWYSPRWKN